MSETLAEAKIHQLGLGECRAETLAALTAGQHTRRLLLIRMLLDSVGPGAATRGSGAADEHADLLETAERAAPEAVRRVLFYPLIGPWAERCVRHLSVGVPADRVRDLAHLASLAAAAAAHAGIGFTTRTMVHDGWVTLPTLGALHSHTPDGTRVDITQDETLLVLRARGESAVRVRRAQDGSWQSRDPRWLTLRTLPGGPRPVFLDDLDPGRLTSGGLRHLGVRGTLAAAEHEHWAALWRGALSLLRLGGADRLAELALLECIVPVTEPPGGAADALADDALSDDAPHFSGTTSQAFGAVLASRPASPSLFAAGIVHELQHAKLAALSELVPLHTAGPQRRYWAPWRADPRPYDGLLHGVYAHLALAAFWQRLALRLAGPGERDRAWAAYARCLAQVGAALPAVGDARCLTDAGRVFVAALVDRHRALSETRPPPGHAARAVSYVETARVLWLRRYG